MIQSGGFLGKILSSIIENWIAIIKISHKTTWIIGFNNCKFRNRCRSSKKIYGSGTTTLITSNEEMNDIMKIVQALKTSGILLKGVTKTIKIKRENKKEDF